MSEPLGNRGDELERLRAEHRLLDHQVRLLVQTEQRLYRSQNELDVQLLRLRALARFSLESTGLESPDEVLVRALHMLAEGFAVDCVCAVRCNPDDFTLTRLRTHVGPECCQPTPIDRAAFDWLVTLPEPVFVSASSGVPCDPARLCAVAVQPCCATPLAVGGGGILAVVPLRHVDAQHCGAIFLAASRPRPVPVRDGGLDPQHLPFLQLLGHHVEQAISTALLTEHLRQRSAELAASLQSLERTQAALVESQKMEAVGRLAGGIAHDFNNLLTVILGCGEELAAALPQGSAQLAGTRSIIEAGRRAAAITRQLLAFGRRQLRRPVAMDLSRATLSAVEVLQRLVGPRIHVELALAAALPQIEADPSQVEQIILNLVVNARDAMPDGGNLRIATRPASAADAERCAGPIEPDAFAVLEIQDTGIGMDEATRAQIFEPFFSTKPVGNNSGLGLAVVYGIVQQSRGHILVDSTVGVGTTFRVLLPFAVSSGAAASAPNADVEPHRPRATILVVEDDEMIRSLVVAALRREGHVVRETPTAEAALRLFEAPDFRPDLLLTDLTLPGICGLQLARAIAQLRPGIRITLMSGYNDEVPTDSPERPAVFLQKPFTQSELVAFVHRALGAITLT